MVSLGNRAHKLLVSRVAPDWDLLKDAQPTELPRRGSDHGILDTLNIPHLIPGNCFLRLSELCKMAPMSEI